jgi:hypothetical protein
VEAIAESTVVHAEADALLFFSILPTVSAKFLVEYLFLLAHPLIFAFISPIVLSSFAAGGG